MGSKGKAVPQRTPSPTQKNKNTKEKERKPVPDSYPGSSILKFSKSSLIHRSKIARDRKSHSLHLHLAWNYLPRMFFARIWGFLLVFYVSQGDGNSGKDQPLIV